MLNNIKTWINKTETQKYIKILLMYLVIVFIVGITTKIIAASYGTHNYLYLIDKKNSSYIEMNYLKDALEAAKSNGEPAEKIAGIQAGLDQMTAGYFKYSNGATDQSIGMYIGWSMIALKLWVYITTFIVIIKALKTEKELPIKYYKFMFMRFVTLFVGLVVGEALTIYFTMRNPVDMDFWTVFSFFSPALSIVFAVGALPYIYKVIKTDKA